MSQLYLYRRKDKAKDLLEIQTFPAVERFPGGPVERPYDVAGWTLPLQMGVRVTESATLPAGGGRPLDSASVMACTPPERDGAKIGRWFILDARDTESYRLGMQSLAAGRRVRVGTERLDLRWNGSVIPPGSFYVERARGRRDAVDASIDCRSSIDVIPRTEALLRAPRIALTRRGPRRWTRGGRASHTLSVMATKNVTPKATAKLRCSLSV